MLIDSYDLDVFTPPCEPGAERFSAIARLKADISEVLPYLNAVLKGAIFNPEAGALSWQRGGRKIVYTAYQIAVSNVEDRDEAIRIVEEEVARVNRTWENRHELTPSYAVRKRPGLLNVYRLLPQTNCKVCGEPTCYVFATRLLAHQHKLEDCTALHEPQYSSQLAQLSELLAGWEG
ncbi:MAG: (Fe-S)-binding protein [Anaerolineae bacterium]